MFVSNTSVCLGHRGNTLVDFPAFSIFTEMYTVRLLHGYILCRVYRHKATSGIGSKVVIVEFPMLLPQRSGQAIPLLSTSR